jgi:thiosulfate dehydrogenase
MNAFIKMTGSTSLVAAALTFGLALSMTEAVAATAPQLEKAVQDGKTLFGHETFWGNGKTCESCHAGGGVGEGKLPNGKVIASLSNAATIFPRFREKSNKVITLSDQVRNCVEGGLGGTPPDYGSEKLTDLVAYLTSLSQGKPIDMGGKPQ